MGGIRLQLLFGVRIELAVGTLPYPGESGFPIISPGRDRPLSGFPICKPCLDVRQNPSKDTHFPSYGRHQLPKSKYKLMLLFDYPDPSPFLLLSPWSATSKASSKSIGIILHFFQSQMS